MSTSIADRLRLPISESMFVKKTDMMTALFAERSEAAGALYAAEAEIGSLKAEVERLREAILLVVAATRAYLPPNGIDAQECLNRILAATDNPIINPIIAQAEHDHVGA